MDQHLNTQFDNAFSKCVRPEHLRWYPWVGQRYNEARALRLLIVGESHYFENTKDETTSNRFTREIIFNCAIGHKDHFNTFDNVWRACQVEGITTPSFWESVAFYNFIQRPVLKGTSPENKDFADSWRVFLEVVKILRPTCCIFIGVRASESFDQAMQDPITEYTPVKRSEKKIGSAHGRTASLKLLGQPLPVVFIKHASAYFPWQRWQDFLVAKCGTTLRSLKE